MPKIHHSAFRYEYNGTVRALLSDIEIISLDDPGIHGTYKGVWDTGAEMTMITPRVFSALKLIQIDTMTICGVNGSKNDTAPVALVKLILPNRIRVSPIRVAVSEIQGIDMLIGIDVIQLGDFSLSTLDRKTVFTFAVPPFDNRTDLLEKANQVNKRNK
jgi:predicted aspartyl protease